MQKVALRHDLVCLLHEKPFAGVNGSGKHNNFSLATDDGVNLFEPGHTPQDNLLFLGTIAALLKGVDSHADILRATAASAGNDHRLGANEVGLKSYSYRHAFRTNSRNLTVGKRKDGQYGLVRLKNEYIDID